MKVLVVGGGAAGLMAAGAALRQGHEVTVLEHMEKPAQKILDYRQGPLQCDQRLHRRGISAPCADEPPLSVLVAGGFPTGQDDGTV